MSDPLSRLSRAHTERLVALVDALGDPPMSEPELASLACVACQEPVTVDNLAAVIRRARGVQ